MSLPAGFRVHLVPGSLSADAGHLVVGGSPLTALRLTDRARALLSAGTVVVTGDGTRHLAERLLATNLGVPDLVDAPQADPADLTVVLPVRDRSEQLDRALTSLTGLRCLVVDDASRDPVAVAAVAAAHGADLLPLTVNVGPAAARNEGLRRVETPYVAFVDSDVEAHPGMLLELTRHFADPAVALVGPRVRGVVRSSRPRWFERYDVEASSLGLGDRPCSVRPGAAVAWLPSACLVARVDAVTAPGINGFDERRRVGEDVDLVWRLVEADWRVRYDPSAIALHDARATLRSWAGRKYFYGTGSARLAQTHGAKVAPAELSVPLAVAAAALLVRRRRGFPLVALGVSATAVRLGRRFPPVPSRSQLAARLTLRGLGWALRQEADLALRHWWPATAVAAAVSPTARRALVSSVVVDVAVAATLQRRPLDPLTTLAGRWADNLAYGAGLWAGAWATRSMRALLPRRLGR